MKEVRIVVVDSGWVLVGVYNEAPEKVILKNASVIRVWGTDRGLGQLVTGPRKQTVLDPVGIVHIELRAVKFSIECDTERWDL